MIFKMEKKYVVATNSVYFGSLKKTLIIIIIISIILIVIITINII